MLASFFANALIRQMKSTIVNSHDALLLIHNAREAEMCRDLDVLKNILSVVWEDIEGSPDYSRFAAPIRAELLRSSGILLSHYGKSRGLTAYQLRAKDLLTSAVELFQAEGDRSKAAEANIALAVAYWFAGEVVECNTILSSIEEEFAEDRDYSILLSVKLNRIGCLNWLGEFDKAIEIIESIHSWVELCPDLKLLAQFHNQAGIIFRKVHLYERSIRHLHRAIEISRTFKNYRFQGLSMNCLAMTYREIGDYASAHIYVKEAILVFESVGDKGWIPHVLDSRALILLDEERVDEALETIDRAISLFSGGEDYSGLTEAMFTKCRCLLRLRREPEAYALFAELGHLASVRIGETALRKYSRLLAGEARVVGGKTLRERTDFLRKDLIREALHSTGGNIVEAADALGESHQALSFMLKRKYAALYDELGIRRRKRSVKPRSVPVDAAAGAGPIQHILMPASMKYAYDFPVDEALDISTYLLSPELMRKLGLDGSKLVAVAKVKELKPETAVLYEMDGVYDIGRLIYDGLTSLFVIEKREGDFVFFTDVSLLGVPIAYCDTGNINRNVLEFKKVDI
jgi:tetratricopeptide (TPR) repeat protein